MQKGEKSSFSIIPQIFLPFSSFSLIFQTILQKIFLIKNFFKGKSISEWIRRERWPPMLQLSASNLHSVADSNSEKKLVLISIEPFDRLNMSTPSGRFFRLSN